MLRGCIVYGCKGFYNRSSAQATRRSKKLYVATIMVNFNVNCSRLRSSKQLSPLITLHFTTIIIMMMIVIKPGFSLTSKDRNSTEINPVTVNFGQQGTNTTNTILNVTSSTGLLEISNGNLNVSLKNATLDSSDKCKSKQAICHIYVHNMYGFYTVFGGYFMSAVVVLGIAFLVITHFHGRHVVKKQGTCSQEITDLGCHST